MYLYLLQFDSPEPISSINARFARFHDPIPDSFLLDVVKGLEGYALVPGRYMGVDRFVLRTPKGRTLAPHSHPRVVCCTIDGKMKYYNVCNLLASHILKRDVTDNEYGVLVGENGLWVESNEDRRRLRDELQEKTPDLPRVELTVITRPNSENIDVTGRGYYVKGGVVYRKNGTRLAVRSNGECKITDRHGKKFGVHIGRVLFTAYPDFYRFDPATHTQIDHIDGDHTNNHPGNFRPVTNQQNRALGHQTGGRMQRPGPTSSHELFKRVFGPLSKTTIERMVFAGALRQYEDTSFWVHSLGVVFRKRRSGEFEYADARVQRNGYVVSGFYHHVMMMKAFGKYVDGQLVMHLNDKKDDNRLDNLRMGTSSENADKKDAVTIHRPGQNPRWFPSMQEAARTIGVVERTLRRNRDRNTDRSGELVYSTSKGIRFAAVCSKAGAANRDERPNSSSESNN